MNSNEAIIAMILAKKKGVSAATASRALNKIKRALEEMEQEDKKEKR